MAVLALVTVDARKLLTQSSFSEQAQENLALKSAPMVEDKQFMIPESGDQKFYWRVDMSPPVLRAGWQMDQSANSKDLTFNLNPASFQSNPRLGTSAANTFNMPLGSKY